MPKEGAAGDPARAGSPAPVAVMTQWQKTIGKTIRATLLVLLALEGLVRAGYALLPLPGEDSGARSAADPAAEAGSEAGSATGTETWYRIDPQLGWTRAPGFTGEVYGASRRFGAEGYLDVDQEQVAVAAGAGGAPTVLIVGDSRSFGNQVPVEATYAEVLDRELPSHAVINVSVPGYSIYQGRTLLAKLLPELRPEIVVAAFGFNDSRYVLGEGQRDGEAWFGRVYRTRTVLETLIRASRLVRLLAAVAGVRVHGRSGSGESLERAHPEDASQADALTLDEVRPRVSPEEFGAHLAAMRDMVERQGARLILLYLPDNPRFMPTELNDGMTALTRGNPEAALEPLRVVAESAHWYSMLARRQWVAALRAAGRLEEAARASRIPVPLRSLHGALPLHFDQEYRHVMGRLATDPGVPFCDGTAALYSARDYFDRDPCHFGVRGHQRVAETLLRYVADSAR